MTKTYDVYSCAECGEDYILDENDVSHHIYEDGIDYDADGDHVAYGLG